MTFCERKRPMTEDPQKQYEDTDDDEPTGAEPILSPWMKIVILWSVILLLIAGGAAATYFGAREVLRAKASMDWPTTQGKIIESSVERETRRRKPGESGSLNQRIFRAKILYEYQVDEATLTGTRIAYVKKKRIKVKGDDTSSIDRILAEAHAQGIVDRYPKGKSVSVYYKPDNPKVCLLEPGLGLQAFVAPVIGVFIFIIGGIIAWAAITGARDKQ